MDGLTRQKAQVKEPTLGTPGLPIISRIDCNAGTLGCVGRVGRWLALVANCVLYKRGDLNDGRWTRAVFCGVLREVGD